jgi:hypothetical protein
MEPSPSWETSSCSAIPEFPNILWNTKILYCVQKSPPLVPSMSQIIQSIPFKPVSQRSILMLSYHILLGFYSGRFPSGLFTRKPCMHLSSLPCMLHALPILCSLTTSFCLLQGIQIMNFLIMQFAWASNYLIPKYLNFAIFLKNLWTIFMLWIILHSGEKTSTCT